MLKHPIDRRTALRRTACGFGSLALAGMCNQPTFAAGPVDKTPHFAQRAKRVIFVFMQGGPSQVDSFDPKPQLAKYDGQKVEFNVARTRKRTAEPVMDALWKFKRYGECGQPVSELFPHIAEQVDDLCFLHGMHTEGVAHGPSTLFLHTGATNLIRPSVGAWITYGLGSENENLPGFVTINPSPTKGGPRNYSNAFLPSAYQGTAIGRPGTPITEAKISYIANQHLSLSQQREHLDVLQQLNREQLEHHSRGAGLDNVIESFELAYRMQSEVPAVMDFSAETQSTLSSYGIGQNETDEFGRQCLMARRFAEAGVRFVQINYSDNSATPKWDQHSNMPAHKKHAFAIDQPVAALLADLKQRGLLDDTLVWWGGEFGRTPYAQNNNGRDHNPKGFTVFLAGGGVKTGIRYGETDEWGYEAISNKVHMHDLHATLLHLLGIDHSRLTYRFAGRDFRLTDIHGSVVHDIIA
ncbi:MAG: DUF1501 domain-containing protein [Planctomycetales bacterium]|nr:DUF1501 domain-containing protein [Planctomycetales bacterium]